jgi:drug/metabolite transporter (DMT)-like permease
VEATSTALALCAALLYAVTSALQHSAAGAAAPELSLRPSLLLDLVRRPRWLLGNLAEVGAVTLQFLALRRGSLLLVQALLITGLLFALPLGAALSRRRLGRNEWFGAIAVVAGLATFVTVAQPTAGRDPSGVGWALVLGLGGALVVALLVRAPGVPGAARATFLGGATGVLYGINAGLVKAVGHLLDAGALHALQHWEPYVLAVLGAAGFLLAQSAFHAGPLAASLPLISAADPVAAAVIGVLAFHERLAGGAAAVAAQLAATAAIVAGVWVLCRSPLVAPPASVDVPPLPSMG